MRHLERRSDPRRGVVPALLLLLATTSCSGVYYSIWEKLGYEKRDLLRSNVEEVREDQQQVSEQFESTLERIKEIYGLEGGDLEKSYDRFKGEYEQSVSRADDLRERIDRVESIAEDLFAEWSDEIELISDRGLRDRSREQLRTTQGRYRQLEAALAKTENGLDPVLEKFRDQVLFLKHNLNAQAVGSLEAEILGIERDVDGLIRDLQSSIREAEAFIDRLPD